MSKELSKPALPRELMQVSLVGSTVFILYSLAMFIVPSALSWRVWQSGAPGIVKIIVIAPLIVLAGQGLHLLGWVAHEGFHFNLTRDKKMSALVGTLFGSMIGGFFTV